MAVRELPCFFSWVMVVDGEIHEWVKLMSDFPHIIMSEKNIYFAQVYTSIISVIIIELTFVFFH